MLISHRRHTGPAGSRIGLDRLISRSSMLRRVELYGVVQDERITETFFGRDVSTSRSRIQLVLQGTVSIDSPSGTRALEAGEFVYSPDRAHVYARVKDATVLEWEWDVAADEACGDGSVGFGKLSSGGFAVLGSLAANIACSGVVCPCQAQEVFVSMGLNPRLNAEPISAKSRDTLTIIDNLFARLHEAPMLVDAADGISEKTVARRVRSLSQELRLTGRGGDSWRKQRDTYRLIVATLFATHPSLSQRELAKMVGYGSVDALDHAFARSGLPSPGLLRRQILSG